MYIGHEKAKLVGTQTQTRAETTKAEEENATVHIVLYTGVRAYRCYVLRIIITPLESTPPVLKVRVYVLHDVHAERTRPGIGRGILRWHKEKKRQRRRGDATKPLKLSFSAYTKDRQVMLVLAAKVVLCPRPTTTTKSKNYPPGSHPSHSFPICLFCGLEFARECQRLALLSIWPETILCSPRKKYKKGSGCGALR